MKTKNTEKEQKEVVLDNILKKSLLSLYNEEYCDKLIEIAEATPCKATAIALILDCYEEPILSPTVTDRNKGILTLKSYDKWYKQVYYTYLRPETKGYYLPKDTDENISIEEAEVIKGNYVTPDYQYYLLKTGVEVLDTGSMDVQEWKLRIN